MGHGGEKLALDLDWHELFSSYKYTVLQIRMGFLCNNNYPNNSLRNKVYTSAWKSVRLHKIHYFCTNFKNHKEKQQRA